MLVCLVTVGWTCPQVSFSLNKSCFAEVKYARNIGHLGTNMLQ